MDLKDDISLANTRARLRELQARYEELRAHESKDPRVRRLSLWSYKKLINQLTEASPATSPACSVREPTQLLSEPAPPESVLC